jgi:hypothetical protein
VFPMYIIIIIRRSTRRPGLCNTCVNRWFSEIFVCYQVTTLPDVYIYQ